MKLILSIALLFITLSVTAQTSVVSGTVIDNQFNSPIPGAKVEFLPKKITLKTPLRSTTDDDGNFSISGVPYADYTVIVSAVGLDSIVENLTVDAPTISIELISGKTIEQEEVEVIGNIVKDRKTPVAVSTIGTRQITEELGSQDLPMILNSKPGVHATQQGGGDGDARITIRGFDQRNVGVMIDGVPVNDMENGWVYWSNWFGLDAITSQIQVQRGLGATKLAMPSVGGTMNILTMSTGGDREIRVKQEYGSGHFLRTSVAYKSGTLKNDWGILFSGSYKHGNGWVDALNTQGAFYYLKIQKKIKDHVVSLSGFGAPQEHGQRSFSQPIEFWDSNYASSLGIPDSLLDATRDRGIRFNQHWGYRTVKGKRVIQNERRNYYHKPQITLKDFWKVNEKFSWSNMAYVSIGRGGGERFFNSSSAILYDSTGQVDWDQLEENNKIKILFGDTLTTADAAYHPSKLKSSQILASAVNNHFWIGGLSQFDYKMNEEFSFSGGVDYRFYKGEHYYEVTDLLGGEYFVNTQDQNAASPMKVVGDKIGRQPFHNHRDGFVQWGGGFGQVEFEKGRWTAFVNVSTVANFYKGVDYFQGKQLIIRDTVLSIGYGDTVNYLGTDYTQASEGVRDHQTDWVSRMGFTFKTGANYNLDENNNIFLNVGYLNRTPQFTNVIDNTRNRVFDSLVNEKILAFEFGYGFRSKKFDLNLNGYFTQWENRPLPFGLTVQDPNDPMETIAVNVPGMDALHMGLELDFGYVIIPKLKFEGMVSFGDWKWKSTETVEIPGGSTVTFFANGVHVGDAAQSTYAGSLRYAFVKGGYLNVKYTYFHRYFSSFDPNSLSTPDPSEYELIDPNDATLGYQDMDGNAVAFDDLTGQDSWKIPGYGELSIHAGYRWRFDKSSLNFGANVFNALNTLFISDATNNFAGTAGDTFDANSAAVFIGQGIRFNASIGFEF